jgi:PKD repeat protein
MSIDKYVIPIIVYPTKFVDVAVVDVDVPTKMFVGESYTIKAKIRNVGNNSVILLPVRLFFDELKVSSMNIPRIDPGQELTVEFTFSPPHASNHNVTIALPLVAGESIADNNIYTVTVDVMAKPVASFTYAPTNPTTADTIQFIDQSYDPDGNITAWHWDFGDGTTSNAQNPTHRYSQAGTYTVTLTVTDNDGNTNSTSKTIIVRQASTTTTTTTTRHYYGGGGLGAGGGGYVIYQTPKPTATVTATVTTTATQTQTVTIQIPTTKTTPTPTQIPTETTVTTAVTTTAKKPIPGFTTILAVIALSLAILTIKRKIK